MANENEEFLNIEPDVMALYNDILQKVGNDQRLALYYLAAAKDTIFNNKAIPIDYPDVDDLTSKVDDLKKKIVNWIKAEGEVSQSDFNGLMDEFAGNFQKTIDAIEHEIPIYYDSEGGRRRRRNHKSKRKVRKTHKKTKRARSRKSRK
jgi:hypothetical protein